MHGGLEAVEAGQVDVQQHHVGGECGQLALDIARIAQRADLEARAGQEGVQTVPKVAVIFDDKHMNRHDPSLTP